MISIIKTAIITIVISFISGLLLEYYKNLAPKILCNIGNGIPIGMNNKKICTYIITVRNISNKTIHELTLHAQSSQNNLKIADAKITKGLKFDSSVKDNILDVYIPFLSKDDEFSVTLYAENQYGVHNKPVVIIRSPENFKQVDSVEQKGVLSSLFNTPKNINEVISKIMKKPETIVPNKKGDFTTVMNKASGSEKTINKENIEILHRNKKPSKNKKAMIISVSIILVMITGVLGKFYFKGISANAQNSSVKTNLHKQSTDTTGSEGGTTKNTGVKSSTDGTTKNTDTKTSTDGTTKNTDANTSTGGTTKNTDTNTSTNGTTKNTDTNTSTDGTTKNADKNTSTGGTTKNTDANTSTDGTSKNTDTSTSTGGTTKSADTNTSTGGTTVNTGN
ncbi:hypothetical protein [Clostridium aciditolerans]|uniref:Uncharacterized protein n=1 Tax=Clostridium aciditolerans TaxID=339861 RepID=A0A934I1V9_9CLOT|nr:hypothetical protein [Clostridium aciditolerans]MBI6874577.1 hypothetical protein [Clostridium aciditolerans]